MLFEATSEVHYLYDRGVKACEELIYYYQQFGLFTLFKPIDKALFILLRRAIGIHHSFVERIYFIFVFFKRIFVIFTCIRS